MPEFFGTSTYFFVAITLGCFSLANLCQKKLKQPLLNPILVSAVMVIAVLKMLDVPNAAYQVGCHSLSFLLTPATICLAIPMYEQIQALKKNLKAILVGIAAGTFSCLTVLMVSFLILKFDRNLALSLLPKGITAAIGVRCGVRCAAKRGRRSRLKYNPVPSGEKNDRPCRPYPAV